METLGHITLNISTVIYIFLFLPQNIHNQLKHSTKHISMLTHMLMILANSFDLIYSIGFSFEWQYIMIDGIFLFFLFMQQLQILNDRRNKKIVIHTLFIFIFLLTIIFMALNKGLLSKNNLLHLGEISNITYNVYWLPQIYKNFKNKNADGFSIIYLCLASFTSSCDIISGITLNWPLPTIIGSSFLLFILLLQITQFKYYSKRKADTIFFLKNLFNI